MCGIIGLVYADKASHVNQALIDGLTILQHRGQDASGIVTSCNNRLHLVKNNGRVADVFTQENIVQAIGNIGVGHVRYPTSGGSNSCEAQPMYTNFPFGIAIAHNGNLTNTDELAADLRRNFRHVNTDSDSEVLLNVFAEELFQQKLTSVTPDNVFSAVGAVMNKCKGAFAVVILINGVGLLAFRDPHGIRPLCFGQRETPQGSDYAVASESVAIDALDPHFRFRLQRDVRAGEAVLVTLDGALHTKQLVEPNTAVFAPCLFEYVYFARPDSILDGVHVYAARARMGEQLAAQIQLQFSAPNSVADVELTAPGAHDIDAVIPVPETSRTAALECARVLGVPYREGLIKNRYIARTFIMPGQETRRRTVRLKLNSIKSEFAGKTVLLVDDSIVRGTTAVELVQMARDAGARKVYFASAAPPVRYGNVYGIDIPTRCELVAHNREVEDIKTILNADRVFYNTLEATEEAVRGLNPAHLSAFESSCFSGEYVTPEVTRVYLQQVEARRGAGRRGCGDGNAGSGYGGESCGGAALEAPPSKAARHDAQSTRDSRGGCEGLHNSV